MGFIAKRRKYKQLVEARRRRQEDRYERHVDKLEEEIETAMSEAEGFERRQLNNMLFRVRIRRRFQ